MQNRSTIFAKNGIIISSKADQNRSLITQNGPSNAVVKKLQMLALASRKKVLLPDFIIANNLFQDGVRCCSDEMSKSRLTFHRFDEMVRRFSKSERNERSKAENGE
jgi:hypothetical protein